MDIVNLVFRWLHILPAILLVGGVAYMRLVAAPAIAGLSEQQRDEVQSAMRQRWARLVMLSTLLLLVSGLVNTFRISMAYDLPVAYMIMLTVKLLLALAIFLLSALLAGKSSAAVKMRQNTTFWLNVNLAMAVVLVCLAGAMRLTDRQPKSAQLPAIPARSALSETAGGTDAFLSGAVQISLK